MPSKLASLRRTLAALNVIKAKAEFVALSDPLGASGLLDKLNRMESTINRCIIAERSGLIQKSAKAPGWDIDAFSTASETAKIIKREIEEGEY